MTATSVLAAHLCPPGTPRPGWVAVDDGIVLEVGDGRPPSGAIDLGDAVLAPGYVDLQVNGVGDIDFAAADPGEWRRAGQALLAHGVTSFCPTFITAPLEAYDGMLARAATARADTAVDAQSPEILGVHLEGPFLGGAPGAHAVELLRPVDVTWIGRVLDDHPDLVRIVTLAPEADPGSAATRTLHAAGVIVALGHSQASYEDAVAAADAGASLVTHLFNGMGPFHHRAPGLIGAALDDERLTPTVIADLVHVHPAVLRLAFARKPTIALVSDVVATVDDDRGLDAHRTPDGRLAGATTLLDRAVANVVSLGVPIERAVAMATSVPAAALGIADRGRIAPGTRADLMALDPSSLHVRSVWVGGEAATIRGSA